MIQHEGSEHAAQTATADAAPPVHERQDDHGQDRHAAPAGGVTGAATAWAPMQQRAMSRHRGSLAGRLQTPPVPLPFKAELEAQFGQSLDGVEAHVGEGAAVKDLGGRGAAEGDVIAFADASPDRATVAHEVTHVLQARSGKPANHPGAEAEANDAKANIEAGKSVGPITQGAAGIHLDSGMQLDPNDIDARQFLQEMISVPVIAFSTVEMCGIVTKHAMAPFITGDFFRGMFAYGSNATDLLSPFNERIDNLIAPSSTRSAASAMSSNCCARATSTRATSSTSRQSYGSRDSYITNSAASHFEKSPGVRMNGYGALLPSSRQRVAKSRAARRTFPLARHSAGARFGSSSGCSGMASSACTAASRSRPVDEC